MTTWSRITLASLILVPVWGLRAADVRDDAGLFSADVIAAARDKLNAVGVTQWRGFRLTELPQSG